MFHFIFIHFSLLFIFGYWLHSWKEEEKTKIQMNGLDIFTQQKEKIEEMVFSFQCYIRSYISLLESFSMEIWFFFHIVVWVINFKIGRIKGTNSMEIRKISVYCNILESRSLCHLWLHYSSRQYLPLKYYRLNNFCCCMSKLALSTNYISNVKIFNIGPCCENIKSVKNICFFF